MIRKNPNGTYTARLGSHGAQRTFDRRKDAQNYVDAQRDAQRRAKAGLPVDKGPITFNELADLWEANFAPGQWRLNMLDYLRKRWGTMLVRTIEPQAFGAWLHSLKGKKGHALSGKTKSHILATARQVFDAGVEWDYLTKPPTRRRAFKSPSQKRQHDINPFESWDEVLAVAEALGTTGPIVRFVCSTGLTSPSEWIDAERKDINRKTNEMRVHGTKTENRAREIPLSDNALSALDDLPAGLSGRLFIGKTGGRFDYHDWRKVDWPAALKKAGLSYRTPNEMRHTFATLALQANVPIDDVADLLGHGDVAVTYAYYRKWTKKMAARSRDLLNTIGKEEDDAPQQRDHG